MNWDDLHTLLPRLRDADADAWAGVSTLLGPVLAAAAAAAIGAGWADASTSDLAHDAWLAIRKNIATFEGAKTPADTAACFRAWARTIVRNLAARAFRDRGARPDGPVAHALLVEPAAPDPSPSAQASQAEWTSRIEALIARLGPDERLIVRRNLFEGVSCRQIAAELGLADHTAVGVWRRQIMAALRRQLGEHE